MIGNDIVDLSWARKESNWQRPGFLEKIFTVEERTAIQSSAAPSQTVWLLWSIKESVYKIISRIEDRRFFAPKKIICELINSNNLDCIESIALYKKQAFKIISSVNNQLIHSIASLDEPLNFKLKNNYFSSKKARQSINLCHQSILAFSNETKLEQKELSIKKDTIGIPHFFYKNKKQATCLSFSHHGDYAAYAMRIPIASSPSL